MNGAAQTAGQKSITFTMAAATTAVAQYTLNTYTLTVQSTPPTGLVISSSTGRWRDDELHDVRRRVRDEREPAGAGDGPGRVHLLAVDGERRGADRRAEVHHVHDDCGQTAVAQYTLNSYTLTVQSTPPTGLDYRFEHGRRRDDELHGARRRVRDEREPAGAGDGPGRVHLLAVDGERRGADRGQKSITFTMSAATTAVAQYTPNTYTLTVQSTPPTGVAISSSTANGGTTNYTMPGLAYGTSVNLQPRRRTRPGTPSRSGR